MSLAEGLTKSLENAAKNSNNAELQRSLITESGPFSEAAIKLQQDGASSLSHIHPSREISKNFLTRCRRIWGKQREGFIRQSHQAERTSIVQVER
jgi:hypothetical protein